MQLNELSLAAEMPCRCIAGTLPQLSLPVSIPLVATTTKQNRILTHTFQSIIHIHQQAERAAVKAKKAEKDALAAKKAKK
jgi:hypothetical protein